MNCLPVIAMELRSASRRKWTFTLRLLFALAGAGACLVVLLLPRLSAREKGQTMLVILSYLSLGFCLMIGGFLTADCISSEKREGTLGLLFLTPLRGADIVLGKMVCHGMQVLYGLCAMFPVFFLPLLAGGVTWGEVSRILLALGLALLLAESVGVLVSVFAMEARQAMLATLSWVALIAALPMIYWLVWAIFLPTPVPLKGVPQLSPIFTVFAGFESSYSTARGPWLYWGSVLALLALSAAALTSAGAFIGRVFMKMASPKANVNTRQMSASGLDVLERNPYEWLMLRNLGTGRSVGLLVGSLVGVFGVMLLGSIVTTHWQAAFSAAFFTALAVHLIAKFRFAVEATRQISTDFSQRTLELLLVTTLPETSIVEAHHEVLRRVARKPLALLIGLNFVLELCIISLADPLHIDKEAAVIFSSFFLGGMVLATADFSTLRWLAIINGLKAATQVKATLKTYTAAMLLPWIGMGLVISVVMSTEPRAVGLALIMSTWVGACLWYDWLLVRLAGHRLQGGFRRMAQGEW